MLYEKHVGINNSTLDMLYILYVASIGIVIVIGIGMGVNINTADISPTYYLTCTATGRLVCSDVAFYTHIQGKPKNRQTDANRSADLIAFPFLSFFSSVPCHHRIEPTPPPLSHFLCLPACLSVACLPNPLFLCLPL